jgi:Na+/proline symporter
MSSIISSLETIVFCSGAILTTAIILWCLWKTCGYVGFPIGKMIIRFADSEGENNETARSTKSGAIVGGFLCYGLIALKTINPVGFPNRSVPGREAYDIAFWMAKFALQACGEAVAVLAILSGVVKVLRLDVRRQVPVSLEKEDGRNA